MLRQPELKGKPFVVGGSPEGRGVVSSASYAAREFGVRSAMPVARAQRLCPGLVIVSSSHSVYSEYSQKVMGILRSAAPLVEQISIDEAFLDISDDPEPGVDFARRIQAEIRDKAGLPTSWGIASNKLVAKIATDLGKPEGLVEVPEGEEAAFLAPLPVKVIWGVGPRTEEVLAGCGIRTIGQLAAVEPDRLEKLFGDRGRELHRSACGIDHSPVSPEHERRSISSERTFSADLTKESQMVRILQHLSEELGARLRKEGLYAGTVHLKLRRPDFSTFSRQMRLKQATDQDREIFLAAVNLLENLNPSCDPVRLLGVGLSGLSEPVRQLNLFDHRWEKDRQLLEALDEIRERFGPDAVRRAVRLKNKRK